MRQRSLYTIIIQAITRATCIGVFLLLMACSKKTGDDNPGADIVPPLEGQVTILAGDTRQLIQGFGCATVFNPPNTSALTAEEFDRLFGSGSGQVGLSILRIRVAPDDTWRTTELNYAIAATQRGARVMASPWSPPANMKTNNSLVGGTLKTDSSAAYAKYLNDFAGYMAANGAPLYAISVQNEPDITVTYESCDWTADAMKDFLKNHGHLVTQTKLMAPESFQHNQTYLNTILSDAGAVANLDLVGAHIYGGGIVENALAKNLGKEVWMTEHLDTNITYQANLQTAVEIHECLATANFNAYIWWYGKRFYGPIGQNGLVTGRGYMISHFARFIRPGSFRVGTSSNSRPEVRVSAYRNAGKLVIVAINTGGTDVNQSVTVQDASPGNLLPYTTTSLKNLDPGKIVAVTAGKFTYLLPGNSITTFIEQ